MILCVTLNPCLDKTLNTPDWKPGDNVRGQSVSYVVGGKGNNVARALKRLGQSARPVTFLGGLVGAHCELLLRAVDGFDPLIVKTEATSRVISTIRSESTPATAFFDPDPAISTGEAAQLIEAVASALSQGGVEALTLSGSSPAPATHEIYSELIALGRARRVPIFLDTYGPPLEAIWGFWPEVIQLNRREAGIHLRDNSPTDADVLSLLKRWASRGVKVGLITNGEHPAIAMIDGQAYRAMPPKISAVNPIGSGDCLLAGLVDARLRGLTSVELLKFGMGCAVNNAMVWDAGAIDLDQTNQWSEQVQVEAI